MAKHSKRNRRRMQQGGCGGGFTVVRRVPIRVQRDLPQAPTLSVEHAVRTSVREAAQAFAIPLSTLYRWRAHYRPDNLAALEPRSRRPRRTRPATWSAVHDQAVLTLRQRYPRMGKDKLRVLLRQDGLPLSASMIGRILTSLRRRQLLREPLCHPAAGGQAPAHHTGCPGPARRAPPPATAGG